MAPISLLVSFTVLQPRILGLDRYIGWPIYLADTDVSANRILVSALLVSASVSATLDIGYIGIGQISAKIHGIYRPKYQLLAKYR